MRELTGSAGTRCYSRKVQPRFFQAALTAIFLLAAYLRFVHLSGPSLWLDEILHLKLGRTLFDQPPAALLMGNTSLDTFSENGLLYYALQAVGQWLQPGDVGVRLVPAIGGTVTVVLMALIGHRLGGPRLSVVAAFVLAVSPLHVYYSREGRPYYLIMALSLVLLWSLLETRSRLANTTAYIGCVLGVYVGLHAVPVLLTFLALSGLQLSLTLRAEPTEGETGEKKGQVDKGKRRLAAMQAIFAALVALAAAYWMYLAGSTVNRPGQEFRPEQIAIQEAPGFQSPVAARSREQFVASLTTAGHAARSPVLRSWLLLGVSALGLVALARRAPANAVLVCGMFLLPAALSAAGLVSLGRGYELRYTSSALPAFVLLTALGVLSLADVGAPYVRRVLPRLSGGAAAQGIAGAIVLLLIAPNVTAALADPQRKLDWRGVAEFVDDLVLDGESILVPNEWPKTCLDYYLRNRGRVIEFVSIWETAALGEREVAARDTGWMLTAGFRKSNEARAWMHGFVPVLKRRQEEMALFFFPDLVTLLKTRAEAGNDDYFVEQFERMQRRFEFGGAELALQGRGWSYVENSTEASFQWITGAVAELGLPIAQAQDGKIRLRAQPFSYPGAPRQQLELVLNDALIAMLELENGWSSHQVSVPSESWNSGANVLYLRPAHRARPIRVLDGAKDRRPLGVALDFVEVTW